jgi:hypothetical protein
MNYELTTCVICNGPVSSAAGYRKIHGVWICNFCLDLLDAPKLYYPTSGAGTGAALNVERK